MPTVERTVPFSERACPSLLEMGEHKSFTNRKTGGSQLTPGQRQQQRQQQRRGASPATSLLEMRLILFARAKARRQSAMRAGLHAAALRTRRATRSCAPRFLLTRAARARAILVACVRCTCCAPPRGGARPPRAARAPRARARAVARQERSKGARRAGLQPRRRAQGSLAAPCKSARFCDGARRRAASPLRPVFAARRVLGSLATPWDARAACGAAAAAPPLSCLSQFALSQRESSL